MKKLTLSILALWNWGGTVPTVVAQDMGGGNATGVQVSSLWNILKAGGPFMIPIGILSVITLALILVYLFSLRRGVIATSRYMSAAEALLRTRDYMGLLAFSSRHNEVIARVMQRTLDFVTKNPGSSFAEAREIAETEGTRQASAMNQQIVYLADIGTIAPMLGLLGTVVGMIKSFSVMASDAVATRPMLPAEGVAEALITTAAGLIVAVPAMAAYAYFRGKVQALVAELEAASTHLMALLAASYREEEGDVPSSKKTRASQRPARKAAPSRRGEEDSVPNE